MVLALTGVGAAMVSGGSSADPRTPPALPGLPPPFLGTAVVGEGRLTAAVDAYGDVVDLRVPGPAGEGAIENPSERQSAGTVPAGTGIVPRVSIGGGPPLPLWRADSVRQRYLPGTNVLRTVARFGPVVVEVMHAARSDALAAKIELRTRPSIRAKLTARVNVMAGGGVRCRARPSKRRLMLLCLRPSSARPASARKAFDGGANADRRWLSRARPLAFTAPRWAHRMYRRSLLVLRALTDRRTGAVAAGARDGWAYVWPRDAGTVAIALASAGYRAEAKRVARFLRHLDLGAAARFRGTGAPVAGRAAQGDAPGWARAAARAAGLPVPPEGIGWRSRADYQEGEGGDYLANAIAAGLDAKRIRRLFGQEGHLRRESGGGDMGPDAAVAWAVRPFPQPALYPLARRSLRRQLDGRGRFGALPSESWSGRDPWTAPTAWSAWSLAALGERRAALDLLGDLRRAATPAGLLPERVDAGTGVPRSTTPLTWSHAFAVLALRELWPGG